MPLRLVPYVIRELQAQNLFQLQPVRDVTPLLIREFQRWMGRLVLLDPKRGADTLVWLASSPEVAGASGGYYAKRRLATPSREARDAAAARRLWQESERLTGLT